MGRVIAVTGAFGILGSAAVEAARAQGYKVALLDFSEPQRAPLEEDMVLGGVDLGDFAQAQAAFKAVAERFGRLDVLFNIAGGFAWETLEDGAPDTWARMHRLNVVTAATACRAALPYLKASKTGRIVNVGSLASLKSGVGMGAYAAAKSGVHRLTESLAEELKAHDVTVNAVLPSILDTPVNRKDMPDADPSQWVAPGALAKVMLFLASEDAAPITGALIPVAGRV